MQILDYILNKYPPEGYIMSTKRGGVTTSNIREIKNAAYAFKIFPKIKKPLPFR